MGATAHNPAGRVSTGGASRCRHVIDPIWRDRRSFYFRSRLATRESTVQTDLRSVSESVIYKMPDRHSGAARRRPALTRPRARVGAYTTQRARRERHGAERRRRGVARGRASRPEVRRERRDVLHPGMRVPLRRERGGPARGGVRRAAAYRAGSRLHRARALEVLGPHAHAAGGRVPGEGRERALAQLSADAGASRSARPSRANDGAARLEVSARTGRARREGVAAGRRARTPRPRASRSSRRGEEARPRARPEPRATAPHPPAIPPPLLPPARRDQGQRGRWGEKIQENLDRDTPETRGRDPIDPIACVASSCSPRARRFFFFSPSLLPPPPFGPRASNPARTPPLISVHAGFPRPAHRGGSGRRGSRRTSRRRISSSRRRRIGRSSPGTAPARMRARTSGSTPPPSWAPTARCSTATARAPCTPSRRTGRRSGTRTWAAPS